MADVRREREREREREKRGVILYVSHISDSTFWCWFRNTHFNFHHPEFYSLRISWPVSNLHSSRSRSPLHIQFLQSISTFDTSFSSRFQTTFSNYSSTGNIFHVTCVVSDTSAFQHYTTRATFLTFHTSFSTCPHVLCFFTSFPHFISRPPHSESACFSRISHPIIHTFFLIFHLSISTLHNSFPTSQISCRIVTFRTILHILYTTFHISQFVFHIPIRAIQFVQQNEITTSKIFHMKLYLHQKNVNKHWEPK